MFILTSDQVTPCQVIRHRESQQERLLGIIYKDWVFIKGETYSSQERYQALKQTQKQLEAGKMCLLVVDDQSTYSICYQESNLEVIQKPSNGNAKWDLERMIDAIRCESGLIQTHRYKFRVYPRSLFGDELVTWLCQYLNCSREEAVNIGEILIEQGWLHHTWDKHHFKDEHLLYRFYQDEGLIIPLLTH